MGRPVFLMKGRQTTWLLLALAGTGSIPDPLISQIPGLKRTQVCGMVFFNTMRGKLPLTTYAARSPGHDLVQVLVDRGNRFSPRFLSLPVRSYWLECRHAHSFILRSKVLPNETSRTGFSDETLVCRTESVKKVLLLSPLCSLVWPRGVKDMRGSRAQDLNSGPWCSVPPHCLAPATASNFTKFLCSTFEHGNKYTIQKPFFHQTY